MRYTDAEGKKVTRPGSPVLFVVVCVVVGLGFYRVDSNDCDRYQKLATVYSAQATRAYDRSLVEVGKQHVLDLQAYRNDVQVARQFGRCPSLVP